MIYTIITSGRCSGKSMLQKQLQAVCDRTDISEMEKYFRCRILTELWLKEHGCSVPEKLELNPGIDIEQFMSGIKQEIADSLGLSPKYFQKGD